MPHPQSTGAARGRFRRAGSTALAAIVALTGLLVVGAVPATAADVAPSVRPIIHSVNSLAEAGDVLVKGAWDGVHTSLGYSVGGVPGTTKTSLELQTLLCGPEADGTGVAFVPASSDPAQRGSAERPKIAAGTPAWESFKWLDTDSGLGVVYGAVSPEQELLTREDVEAALSGEPYEPAKLKAAFPKDALISLVVYCTKGYDSIGLARQPMTDPDGYAVSTWLTFRAVASTTDPAQTSAGFEIPSNFITPVVTLADQWAGGVGTLTASLKDEAGVALTGATGAVDFYRGTGTARTKVGSGPVSATGTATLPLAGLVPSGGTAQFDAEYVPDQAGSASYVGATSSRYTVIAPTVTTTTLAVTGDLVGGATQTLKATVSPVGATGTVAFRDGVTELGSAPVASGSASISRALAVGAHALTATFTATDVTFVGSASAAQTVTIAPKPAVSPALAASGTPATYGKAATVTVTAAAAATGAVTLTEGGRALGSGTLGGGTAIITLGGTALAPGGHQLTVSYPGDAGHTAANTSVALQVAPGTTTTSAKVTTKKIVRKKTAAKVSVTVKATGFTPIGKVTIYQGKKKVGTATLKNGKATVKLKKFAKAGTAKLTVTYAGAPTGKASSKKLTVKVRSR